MTGAEHDRTHAYRLGYIDAMNAARAWQALRDWLDGDAASWQKLLDDSLMFEYQAGWEAGTLMIQGRCVAWQMVINFLNGTPEQWHYKCVWSYDRGYDDGYEDRTANLRG